MAVLLETSKGDLVIDLYTEKCPLAAKNFLKLAKIKYYNNCEFFKVEKDFIVQTGDPTNTGKGGESVYGVMYGEQAKYFEDEIHKEITHSKVGMVAMVTGGKDRNGSQFYITCRPNIDYLDGKATIFGEVAEGLDVLMKINETPADEEGKPLQIIRIRHCVILDDPFPDPPNLQIPDQSPPPPDYSNDTRIREDEDPFADDIHGRSVEELEKAVADKEAKSRAVVLEMVGDIPDAEFKPPENVLFVCRLHRVTQDDDLMTIFSRFGPIRSCEVIRDWKTGDSLNYAFIEFEKKEDCEQAYFKMDNVLIDDRRIHVDFSQSVSKLWRRHKMGLPGDKGGGDGKDAEDVPTRGLKRGYEFKKPVGGPMGAPRGGPGGKQYEILYDEAPAPAPRAGGGGPGPRPGPSGADRGRREPPPPARRDDRDDRREDRRDDRRDDRSRERERDRDRDRDREREREREKERERERERDRERDRRRGRSRSRSRSPDRRDKRTRDR
eukprot:tig00001042_g6603.t1